MELVQDAWRWIAHVICRDHLSFGPVYPMNPRKAEKWVTIERNDGSNVSLPRQAISILYGDIRRFLGEKGWVRKCRVCLRDVLSLSLVCRDSYEALSSIWSIVYLKIRGLFFGTAPLADGKRLAGLARDHDGSAWADLALVRLFAMPFPCEILDGHYVSGSRLKVPNAPYIMVTYNRDIVVRFGIETIGATFLRLFKLGEKLRGLDDEKLIDLYRKRTKLEETRRLLMREFRYRMYKSAESRGEKRARSIDSDSDKRPKKKKRTD